jgi:branched-chain amino acid transport system permease protein
VERDDGLCRAAFGHALYVGLAGYLSAVLFKELGIGPWLGLALAIPLNMLAGAAIAFLALRFGVTGVYFAILTIAFAEFARIGFDHLAIVNGAGGLFLPVAQYGHNDLWHLRGTPAMFYYVALAATAFALVLCRALLKSRIGYVWQAIREDEQAARAVGIDTFRYKMAAVAISAGMMSFGGVFYAFYYNNLFPEQVFNIARSIEVMVGPIIGGLGTLIGPIVGALVLTTLGETLNGLLAVLHLDVPGAKQVLYGLCLLFVIAVLPGGVWPWLARRLGMPEGER